MCHIVLETLYFYKGEKFLAFAYSIAVDSVITLG